MNNLTVLGWDNSYGDNLPEHQKNSDAIARVIAEHKNAFIVHNGSAEYRTTISGRFFHNIEQTSDMPVVGDWVLLRHPIESGTVIEQVLPRKTVLTRRAPNDRKTFGGDHEQIIASNIDIVFIVTSLNQNFNLSRIERTLALVYSSGAMPAILLSKADLCDDAPSKINMVEQIAFGVPVISFSNVTMSNIERILELIEPGKTACLIGSSGVGKTSLMNILCGRAEKTSEIRVKDARGRHATTSRSLYILTGGGMLIDTPGLREMGLIDSASDMERLYGDIDILMTSCRFSNCSHTNEPGCAVRAAIEDGTLDERRFRNYTKVLKESAFQNNKAAARRAKQEKNKKIAKLIRSME